MIIYGNVMNFNCSCSKKCLQYFECEFDFLIFDIFYYPLILNTINLSIRLVGYFEIWYTYYVPKMNYTFNLDVPKKK